MFGSSIKCKVIRMISQVNLVKELRDPDYGSTLSFLVEILSTSR